MALKNGQEIELVVSYELHSCRIINTSGFATTHVVVSKTSYHLLISPPPSNLPNALKIHTGENKIDR